MEYTEYFDKMHHLLFILECSKYRDSCTEEQWEAITELNRLTSQLDFKVTGRLEF